MATLIFNFLFYSFSSYGFDTMSYQKRQKSFEDWQQQQIELHEARQKAADKQRILRGQLELKKIRDRLSFHREYYSTASLEDAYLKSLEGQDEKNQKIRKEFSVQHRKALDDFEKYILPLQAIEYGLDEKPEVNLPEKEDMNE